MFPSYPNQPISASQPIPISNGLAMMIPINHVDEKSQRFFHLQSNWLDHFRGKTQGAGKSTDEMEVYSWFIMVDNGLHL
jgi:hypothetical protein